MAVVNCNIASWIFNKRLRERLDIPVQQLDLTDLLNTAYLRTGCKTPDCYTPTLPCDTKSVFLCNLLYTGEIEMGQTGNGDTQFIFSIDESLLLHGTAPYTYSWTVDEDIWDMDTLEGQGTSEIVINRLFWLAINNTPIDVVITDINGCITKVNGQFDFDTLCDASSGGSLLITAPDYNSIGDNSNGTDRSIVKFTFDENSATGLTPPLTIGNWSYQGQGITPINLVQNQNFNFFQRTIFTYSLPCASPGANCISITARVTDVHGCFVIFGLTVEAENLACLTNTGEFTVSNITNNSVTVNIGNFNALFTYDVSIVPIGNPDNYTLLGQTIAAIPFPGLTANTQYRVKVKVHCPGGGDTPTIGPYFLTTLP